MLGGLLSFCDHLRAMLDNTTATRMQALPLEPHAGRWGPTPRASSASNCSLAAPRCHHRDCYPWHVTHSLRRTSPSATPACGLPPFRPAPNPSHLFWRSDCIRASTSPHAPHRCCSIVLVSPVGSVSDNHPSGRTAGAHCGRGIGCRRGSASLAVVGGLFSTRPAPLPIQPAGLCG